MFEKSWRRTCGSSWSARSPVAALARDATEVTRFVRACRKTAPGISKALSAITDAARRICRAQHGGDRPGTGSGSAFGINSRRSKSAKLVASEEEEIEKRYKLATSGKRLVELSGGIAEQSFRSTGFRSGATRGNATAASRIGKNRQLGLRNSSSAHAAAVVELSEIAQRAFRLRRKLDLDPEQLQRLSNAFRFLKH